MGRPGSQLEHIVRASARAAKGQELDTPLGTVVRGRELTDGSELSPQQWLPQPTISAEESARLEAEVVASMLRAVAVFDGLSDVVLPEFGAPWNQKPPLADNHSASVSDFFEVANGKSVGEKHYSDGPMLDHLSAEYTSNSIIRLVDGDHDEVFEDGGITVTAFGQASRPTLGRSWPGATAEVRFACRCRQICDVRPRTHVVRHTDRTPNGGGSAHVMAIKSRLERLMVTSPDRPRPDTGLTLARQSAERNGGVR